MPKCDHQQLAITKAYKLHHEKCAGSELVQHPEVRETTDIFVIFELIVAIVV